MKKKYTSPKLTSVGTMATNTLGSSGTQADSGTRRPGVYGKVDNPNDNKFNRKF